MQSVFILFDKSKNTIVMYLGIGFILLLLALAIVVITKSPEINKIIQIPIEMPEPSYKASENFQNLGTDLPIGGGDSPALDQPRTPYGLLNDVLPPLMTGKKHEMMNSQTCYERDYKAQSSLTGNYSKITNNVMTTYPDTCTGPRQEFMLGIYEAPGVAYV